MLPLVTPVWILLHRDPSFQEHITIYCSFQVPLYDYTLPELVHRESSNI